MSFLARGGCSRQCSEMLWRESGRSSGARKRLEYHPDLSLKLSNSDLTQCQASRAAIGFKAAILRANAIPRLGMAG
jgi:hypothetical protein